MKQPFDSARMAQMTGQALAWARDKKTEPLPGVAAIVMAGGTGSRLFPLTKFESKPALAVLAGRRVVDFSLSNLFHSGIRDVVVAVQYKPESLVRHLDENWRHRFEAIGGSLQITGPISDREPPHFKGTADAVFQSMDRVNAVHPSHVLIMPADHICKINLAQFVDCHRCHPDNITIATIPVDKRRAKHFGIVEVQADGAVSNFVEKPEILESTPGRGEACSASMGIYALSVESLRQLAELSLARGWTDFGQDILPALVKRDIVYSYDYSLNRIPGLGLGELATYWQDIGTIEAFHETLRDLRDKRCPLDLRNRFWPILGETSKGNDRDLGRSRGKAIDASHRQSQPPAQNVRLTQHRAAQSER